MIIVLCVPIRNEFPLHGHPGMTVLSKLSSSFVYAKAYDWISFDSTNGQTIETGEVKMFLHLVYLQRKELVFNKMKLILKIF